MSQSFFERRSFVIIAVAVFLMPFLLRGTRLALESNRNDVRDWLPSDFPETKVHRWFQQHFPLEQFVLLSWKGATPDDPGCTLDDPRLEMLARKLEDFDPNLEELGITGKLARLLQTNRLNTLRAIEQYGDLKLIEGIGPQQAAEVTDAISAWASPFKSPVLTGRRLADMLKIRYEELSDDEVLKRLEGSLIGEDHEKTCLVVTLSKAAKGKKLRATLKTIRRIADEECAIPVADICMGGPPVDNVAIDVEGEKTLFRLAGLSAVVGLGIAWLCFRDFRLTFLVFFIALLAAGIGLASVYFVGLLTRLFGMEAISSSYGTVDAILLSMPSVVYVLAISGAVHIVNYYHDSVRSHGLDRAPQRALSHGWIPCTLAAITTAVGLGSLMASHLVPINKFGIYSAWGVIATLALLFLFLPACLHYFPSREYVAGGKRNCGSPEDTTAVLRFWRVMGGFIVGHNRMVTAGCLAVMVVFAVGLTQIKTSVKLMKLFADEAEIIQHYGWLEENLGPLVPMEVIVRVDNAKCKLSFVQRMRLAQQVERSIERLDDVGGALSAATFAPDIAPYKSKRGIERFLGLNRRRDGDRVMNMMLEGHRKSFREYLTVDGDATLDDLGIDGKLARRLKSRNLTSLEKIEQYDDLESIDGISPEEAAQIDDAVYQWQSTHGEELWRVSARVWALTDLDYGVFVDDLRAQVEPVLAAYRSRGVEGIEATYTGLVPLVYKAQHELMSGLYSSLKWAFGLIAVVMIFVLRSPLNWSAASGFAGKIAAIVVMVFRSVMAGTFSMIPNLFPVVVIFGAMGWTMVLGPRMGWSGILVDVGTMMTASVALGVAVDDTVHFLTWFRRGLDKGHDRKGAVMLAYERCGTAMTQTTLIGGLGLSVFAFSTFTPTQRFGVLMLALLAAALVGDLIFLPAVLSGPVGRFFSSSKTRKKSPGSSTGDGLLSAEVSEALPEEEIVAMPIAGTTSAVRTRRNSSHRPTKVS